MLEQLQRAQTASMEKLLERVFDSIPARTASESSPTPQRFSVSGNLSKCSARYSGLPHESVDGFIDAVESFKECADVSDSAALRGFSMLLTHEAATWWQGIKVHTTTWDSAIENLRSAYGDRRPPHRIYRELFAVPQGVEKTDIFVARARALLARLPKNDLCEKVELDMVYGLLQKRIRERIRREEVATFAELLRRAREVEDAGELDALSSAVTSSCLQTRARDSGPSAHAAPLAPLSRSARVAAYTATAERDNVLKSTSMIATPASTSACPAVEAPVITQRKQGNKFCVYCKKGGHNRTDCAQLKRRTRETDSNTLKCYGCGAPGVIRAQCTNCNKDSFLTCDVFSNTNNSVPQSNVKTECYTSLPQSNVKTECYTSVPQSSVMTNIHKNVTSGVSPPSRNVCLPNMFNNHQVVELQNFTLKEQSASVISYHTRGRPILYIEIYGFRGTGLVDTAAKRSIAGSSLYALLRKQNHSFQDSHLSIKLADGLVRDLDVKLAEIDVKLEGVVIPTTFVILPEARNNDTLLGIDFLRKAGIILDLATDKWFTTDRPQIAHLLQCETSRNYVDCAAADVLRTDEGVMLPPSDRSSLAELLQQYDDIFGELGAPTSFAEHRIETGNHPPISVPPYRLTPAKRAVMEAQLDKMLKEGIIEECESAWAAPALLVPKKDGTYRFCVDYRKLNAVTKSDAYPLPVIDDLLQYTGKSCFMSTIDLRSGYWQVAVKQEDQDKTAFVTPFGIHRFKRMPFGLRNAPATFQRLIDRFRSGAAFKDMTLLGYIDDIIVISPTFKQHLQDLQAVFDRLRVFGLRANRTKCVFARDKIKYLGHIITPHGVSPDPDKVAAIANMKEPSSLKHLKTFLQTCSWFRKFVPNFSKVAQPLTLLTKKDQTWKWEEDQVYAFIKLKNLLTTAPILTQPDYNLPFILRTDASNYALGAVLLQGESPSEERPIEYASRLLLPAERNYSTTEREALAVVWAVEKFRGYIDGHKVQVASDHQPLKWLLTLKTPTGRLVRWAMKLQSFDLKVDYTPGKANLIADTLSRPPCDTEDQDSCGICTVIVETPSWDATTLRQDQIADPELFKIVKELEGQEEVAIKRWTERGYYMSKGVLYRYADAESEEPQLVVPENLRKKVMLECHDAATSGHGGIERTLSRISQRFFFPGMRRYVEEYLKTCVECQRYKPSNQKPTGLIQTPVPAQRFEILAVDLFGPLPKGPKGERWILIVEDTASKWIEVFALVEATAEACAKVLIAEVFMRYGVPRRLISDNGVQFVADVMQHAMFTLGVKQNLVPLYHPEANPVERKNRELKTQLAILVEGHHNQWPEVLSFIRFALNTSFCKTTQQTPAYLTFARELRSPIAVQSDLRAVIQAENYVPQITPYLLKLAETLSSSKECIENQQDLCKAVKDKTRKADELTVGDLVLMKTHVLSNTAKGVSSKFIPKRDGPYLVQKKVSPTTYLLSYPGIPEEVIGKYHISDLRRYHAREGECSEVPQPVAPKRRRGRPKKGQVSS